MGYKHGLEAGKAADSFMEWAAAQQPRDLIIYADGSQVTTPGIVTGAGSVLCRGPGHPVAELGSLPLPRVVRYYPGGSRSRAHLDEPDSQITYLSGLDIFEVTTR